MLLSADGCKAGWLVAKSTDWPCSDLPRCYITRDFSSLLTLLNPNDLLVIDIPIGLPRGREPRMCDARARELLGGRARNRVFLAPPRETLAAKAPEAFQEKHKRARQVGAGYPVWGIVPKLREVDERMTPKLQDRVFEFHPEVAWWRINNKVSLHPKRNQEGIRQRISILSQSIPELQSTLQWTERLGRAAKLDDLLDALVGLTVAKRIASGMRPLYRIPESDPPTDERGLRMEIWH